MTENPTVVVAAALIDPAGKILLQQRSSHRHMGGLWEFPGGKLEPAETPEDALVRELREELGVQVDPIDLSPAAFASASLGHTHLILLLYLCRRWQGKPQALDAEALAWTCLDQMSRLPMPPADEPLVELLKRLI